MKKKEDSKIHVPIPKDVAKPEPGSILHNQHSKEDIVAFAKDFIERYRECLEALAKK